MGTSEETVLFSRVGGSASQINISIGSKSDCFSKNKQTNQGEKWTIFWLKKSKHNSVYTEYDDGFQLNLMLNFQNKPDDYKEIYCKRLISLFTSGFLNAKIM